MQGESYVQFRYVDRDMLLDGRLPASLDHSRGDHITYLYAEPNNEGVVGVGSARIIDAPLDDLFAASLPISPENRQLLEKYYKQGRIIRELGGVALAGGADAKASFSIVRETLQRAIRNRTGELLLGSQTNIALGSYRRMFGSAVQQIGGATPLETGNGKRVNLTPVLSDTSTTLDTLLADIRRPELDDLARERLSKSLIFLCDGLRTEEMSDQVNEFLSEQK